MLFNVTAGLIRWSKSGRRAVRRSNSPAWFLAAVAAVSLCSSRLCDGQIEVNAYISGFGLNNLYVLDTATNTLVGSPIPVGGFPEGVAVTPDGRFTYVANVRSNTVSVVDAATNTVIGSPIAVGTQPEGIAITPNGKFAYVTNTLSNTVSVISTANDTTIGSPIAVGGRPFGVAITPDGRFAYVTNGFSNTVSVINTATNTVVGSPIAVGDGPNGIAVTPDGKFAYVTNGLSNTVSVINTATNTAIGSPIAVGTEPVGIAITPDGRFAYVANGSSNTVSVINTATKTVIGSPIPLGQSDPFGVAITPDGKFAYVTTVGRFTTVLVIDTATNMVVDQLLFPSGDASRTFGSFIGPNVIVARGGPLLIANDVALTGLGFGNFIDFNGGTLQTTGSLNTSRTISLLAQGGTIDTNGFNSTFSGDIINSGSLTKIGLGTLTLAGNSTYSGGTEVSGGTLRAGSATGFSSDSAFTVNTVLDLNGFSNTIASLSGSGTVTNNGSGAAVLTVGRGNAETTFSGILTDGSSALGLTKIGPGTLTLSGNNTYSGSTVLDAGTLVIAGPQALGIGDVIVNGGFLRADPQPINVKGNYTQSAGGTLQLSIGGTATGQFDFLNVGGHATLGGTLQVLSLNGFQPKIGDRFTVVTAAGGISGQFTSALNPFSVLSLDLIYQPNTVLLEFASNFAAFARTPNQRAVANQLDRVALDPREAQLVSFLTREPLANLPGDLEKISPDALTAFYEISFSAATIQAVNLENRFAEIRSGSTGFSSSLRISNTPTIGEGTDAKAVLEPTKNVLQPSPENKWGVWISGTGDFVNVSGDGNGQGYNFSTGGVAFGVDYRLTNSFALGIAGGYGHSWTDLSGSGSVDVDSGKGGLYATYYQGGLHLGSYTGGGYNSYYARRDVLGRGAAGTTNGGEFDAYFGGGYDFHCRGLTFGPIASLQYTYVDVGGYTEKGSLAPLRIVPKSEDSYRTNLGVSASYTWNAGHIAITPSASASWQHEYLYSALPIDAQFASGVGSVFTVHGPTVGHDSALIDVGVNVRWTPVIRTYLGYSGQVGRSNFNSHALIGSVQVDF
jgi:outer membrane autotransporter protein